jgi:heme/copper-type cytochrome/quinol oxidase subunit 1
MYLQFSVVSVLSAVIAASVRELIGLRMYSVLWIVFLCVLAITVLAATLFIKGLDSRFYARFNEDQARLRRLGRIQW